MCPHSSLTPRDSAQSAQSPWRAALSVCIRRSYLVAFSILANYGCIAFYRISNDTNAGAGDCSYIVAGCVGCAPRCAWRYPCSRNHHHDSSDCTFTPARAPRAPRNADGGCAIHELIHDPRSLDTRHLVLIQRIARTPPTDTRSPTIIHLPSARHIYPATHRSSGERCRFHARLARILVHGIIHRGDRPR